MFIAETSHFGVGRAGWLREIADEVGLAIEDGTPIRGVCLYPILDRPDWVNAHLWHHSGLWDLEPDAHGRLERLLIADYAAELKRAQRAAAVGDLGVPTGA